MVVRDDVGYKGFPLGVVEDGADVWVVVRWTERHDGEPCAFVNVEDIENLQIEIGAHEKLALIMEAVK